MEFISARVKNKIFAINIKLIEIDTGNLFLKRQEEDKGMLTLSKNYKTIYIYDHHFPGYSYSWYVLIILINKKLAWFSAVLKS